MGKQQFDVLRGIVRKTLQRRFGNCVRSAGDGISIEGANPAPCFSPTYNGGSDLNSRSKFTSNLFSFSSSSSRCGIVHRSGNQLSSAQKFVVLQENVQTLREECLDVFLPTQFRRRLYVSFCQGPSSVLTSITNVVKVFGSLPTVSRGFSSSGLVGSRVEGKVGEAVAPDGVRGEGQGGDEGLTASISGRETPAKKQRRKKTQVQGTARDVEIRAEATGSNSVVLGSLATESAVGVEASDNKVTEAGINFRDGSSAGTKAGTGKLPCRNTESQSRKRNREVVSREETSSKAVVVDYEQSLDSATSSSTNFSLSSRSSVHPEDGLPSELQCTTTTSSIFGMDFTQQIPVSSNVQPAIHPEIIKANSATGSDSDLEKQPGTEEGDLGICISGNSAERVVAPNQQELR